MPFASALVHLQNTSDGARAKALDLTDPIGDTRSSQGVFSFRQNVVLSFRQDVVLSFRQDVVLLTYLSISLTSSEAPRKC